MGFQPTCSVPRAELKLIFSIPVFKFTGRLGVWWGGASLKLYSRHVLRMGGSESSQNAGIRHIICSFCTYLLSIYYVPRGLPWWLSGKESSCQYRRHSFDPWVEKIPWRRKWQPTPVFLPGNLMDRGAWWPSHELDTS